METTLKLIVDFMVRNVTDTEIKDNSKPLFCYYYLFIPSPGIWYTDEDNIWNNFIPSHPLCNTVTTKLNYFLTHNTFEFVTLKSSKMMQGIDYKWISNNAFMCFNFQKESFIYFEPLLGLAVCAWLD